MPQKFMHIADLRKLIVKALMAGAKTHSFYRFEWNLAGRCKDPVHIEMHGREYTDRDIIGPRHPQMLELWTKCRTCDNCRWERQMFWAEKATREYEQAPRTWFGTFTMSPSSHHKMIERARNRLHKGGTNYDGLGTVEQFYEQVTESGRRELTLYFKRLRKKYKARIRYLLVCEPHKSGYPHYHVLIHEVDPKNPVRKKHLVAEWPHGFTKFKLVGNSVLCRYVAKYLGKTKTARVRASLGYGGVSRHTRSTHTKALPPSVTEKRPSEEGTSEDDCSSKPERF